MVMLLWPRPDLNLASIALLTGLVHASMPPTDADEWQDMWDQPPEPDELKKSLASFTEWFELDGDGPRFMQDRDALDGEQGPVDRLFIDSSVGSTVKKNADLAVRRGRYSHLSRPAAAIALYALQQFAPAGGRGLRTSICGGGPMYTFVEPSSESTLWETIWTNVPYGKALTKEHAADAFPWAGATRTSEQSDEVQQPQTSGEHIHCAVWFGQPRRIRLSFVDNPGVCDLTGVEESRVVSGLIQRPFGNNYIPGQWRHPASPYYCQKAGAQWLPAHLRPGRFGYRHYLGVALQNDDTELRRRAETVREVANYKRHIGDGFPRLLVGGWAMDKAKPLDFIQSRMPVPLAQLRGPRGEAAAGAVRAATLMGSELAGVMKDVFGVDEKGTGVVSDMRIAFFDNTEKPFHTYLAALSNEDAFQTLADGWRSTMEQAALRLFDRQVESVVLSLPPERVEIVVKARRRLLNSARGYSKTGKKIFELLDLTPPVSSKKSSARVS